MPLLHTSLGCVEDKLTDSNLFSNFNLSNFFVSVILRFFFDMFL